MATNSSSVSKKRPTRFVIPLLIAVAIIFAILAPLFALIWAGQPFLGTFFYPWLISSDSYVPASWRGQQNAELLAAIGGVPVSTGLELFTQLQQKQIGDRVTLDLRPVSTEIGEPSGAVSVVLDLLTWSDFMIYFWLPYGIGLVYLILGFIVYHLRSGERIGGVFVSF